MTTERSRPCPGKEGKFLIITPPAITAIVFAAVMLLCSGCYTLTQGSAMFSLLGKAVPLESIAVDPSAPNYADDKAFVDRVTAIRAFAFTDLGLSESKNYTTYVDIDRDYLAAVVSACAADSFTPYEWHFPIVGTVPYKGFFDVNDAKELRAELEEEGYDVWVRGVDAFSTLGWFRDPLYSYMKKYDERALADLIIHELTHATVFIKDQVKFNEEFAEFVGSEGARLYLQKTLSGEAFAAEEAAHEAAARDAETFRRFIRDLARELDAVYADPAIARDEKLRRKIGIIAAAQARFDAAYGHDYGTQNYRGFSSLPVNNAYIELYRLYYSEDDRMRSLYEKTGVSLAAFIAAAKAIPADSEDPFGDLVKLLRTN